MKAQYNKSQIMKKAWQLFKNEVAKDQNNRTDSMFSECLKQSWQIAKGQPSIESLYKAHYQGIFNFINMKIHNIDDAQELTNDTFIKALQNMHLFNAEKSSISTWLHNIAKNCVIDHYRKDQSDKYINVSNFTDEAGKEMYQFTDNNRTDDILENKELSENIRKAMSTLKPKYKKVAELYFIKDQPYNEIAEALEMPVGSVKGMVFRIKEMLQGRLQFVYQNA
jgi:RNA polymerase sigma-70 factor (ECF subfamily)